MATVYNESTALQANIVQISAERSGGSKGRMTKSKASSSGHKGAKTETETRSILKRGEYWLLEARRDWSGTPIVDGGKKHKIQFKQKMLEVTLVESYKLYNVGGLVQQASCTCRIF